MGLICSISYPWTLERLCLCSILIRIPSSVSPLSLQWVYYSGRFCKISYCAHAFASFTTPQFSKFLTLQGCLFTSDHVARIYLVLLRNFKSIFTYLELSESLLDVWGRRHVMSRLITNLPFILHISSIVSFIFISTAAARTDSGTPHIIMFLVFSTSLQVLSKQR